MPTLNVKSLVAGIRDYLDSPPYDVLSNGTILMRLSDKLDHYKSRLHLSGQNWLLAPINLYIIAGQTDYTITKSDFGRLVSLETTDDSNPFHLRSEQTMVGMQNLTFYTGTGEISASIFRQGSVVKLRFSEAPTVSATLRGFYEPTRTESLSIEDDEKFIGDFGNLLKVDTALSCLAKCNYDDTKHTRIERTLDRDFKIYYPAFDEYSKSNMQEDTGPRRMWPDAGY